MRLSYQLRRHWNATRLNLALIDSYLDPEAQTGLDIGSNEGVATLLLAKRGLNAKGIEARAKNRQIAEKLSHALNLIATFEDRIVSLEEIREMDEVDVTLFLSVHHQIAAHNGLSHANEFLLSLAAKTRKQLFFQPACIKKKYRQDLPFEENDLTGISQYFLDLLADEFPHRAVIGYSINDIPKSEPFRPMLLFSRAPIEMREDNTSIVFLQELRKKSRSAIGFSGFVKKR